MTSIMTSKTSKTEPEQKLSKVIVLEQQLSELEELEGKVSVNNETILSLTHMLNETQKENKTLKDLLYKIHEIFSETCEVVSGDDSDSSNDSDEEIVVSTPVLEKESNDPHEIIFSECVNC